MINLSGKNCVVTGANRGIGLAISNRLKSLDANVVGIDVETDKDDIINVDITDREQIKDFANSVDRIYKAVDVLVNCAGITIPENGSSFCEDNWRKTMSVNLDGAFFITNSLLNSLKKSKNASIINITSLNSSLGFPNNPSYVASKTGLLGLTRSWAVDLGKYNIRSNCVSPGYIKTEMTKNSWSNEDHRISRASKTCLDRWGETEEIANVVAFLGSDMSSYITGQMINVDGGWTAKGL